MESLYEPFALESARAFERSKKGGPKSLGIWRRTPTYISRVPNRVSRENEMQIVPLQVTAACAVRCGETNGQEPVSDQTPRLFAAGHYDGTIACWHVRRTPGIDCNVYTHSSRRVPSPTL